MRATFTLLTQSCLITLMRFCRYCSSSVKSIRGGIKSLKWADKTGAIYSHSDMPALPAQSIDVISWNVLGPIQGESSKHTGYASSLATQWWKRKLRILQDLTHLDPAVICLQEMSHKSVTTHAQFGYECASYAPSQAMWSHAAAKTSHLALGNAIFTKSDKIRIISAKKMHLKNFMPLSNCQSAGYRADVQKKWHSMALCHLKLKSSNQSFLLANTHLFWDPTRPDVKALQTQAVINGLGIYLLSEHISRGLPLGVIICGDFNCDPLPILREHRDPQRLSAAFELLTRGELASSHPEHPDSWFSRLPMMLSSPRIGSLKVPTSRLLMSNVYLRENFRAHTPAFTTKTDEFAGWIDHMWTNKDVVVERVLRLPVTAGPESSPDAIVDQIRNFPCIPTEEYPSDHLPTGCVVSLQ